MGMLDYLSIIHRNGYRMKIIPDQRAMFRKYLRFIEAELDNDRGIPGPPSPKKNYTVRRHDRSL